MDIATKFKDKICKDMNFDLVLIDYMKTCTERGIAIDIENFINIFTSEKLIQLFSNDYPHTCFFSLN